MSGGAGHIIWKSQSPPTRPWMCHMHMFVFVFFFLAKYKSSPKMTF